jgi:hypothetical protein
MAQATRSTARQDSPADVRAETLQTAAELLVLLRDTLRIIDGAGPRIQASPSESTPEVHVGGTEAERVSSPNVTSENSNSAIRERTDMVDQALSAQNGYVTSRDVAGDQKQSSKPAKCTFSEVVPNHRVRR